jgi:hypothetical protein
MFENSLIIPTWNNGCLEEMVILNETSDVLKYTFSNSLDSIKIAVYSRTGYNLEFNQAFWYLNHKLSISVKNLMNFHKANYSMTTEENNKELFVIVNMRVSENWFTTIFQKVDNVLVDQHIFSTFIEGYNYAFNELKNDNE